jgi:hypothetical protein
MQFLKHLRLARLFSQYQPSASVTIDWTEGDRKNLSAFFESKTGAKLRAVSSAHIAQSAMNACAEKQDHNYHCGIAQGVRVTWATLASLEFRQPSANEGTQVDDSGIPEEFK